MDAFRAKPASTENTPPNSPSRNAFKDHDKPEEITKPTPATVARDDAEGRQHGPEHQRDDLSNVEEIAVAPTTTKTSDATTTDPTVPIEPQAAASKAVVFVPPQLAGQLPVPHTIEEVKPYDAKAEAYFNENKDFFAKHGHSTIDTINPNDFKKKKITVTILKALTSQWRVDDEEKGEEDCDEEEKDNSEEEGEFDINHDFDFENARGQISNYLEMNCANLVGQASNVKHKMIEIDDKITQAVPTEGIVETMQKFIDGDLDQQARAHPHTYLSQNTHIRSLLCLRTEQGTR